MRPVCRVAMLTLLAAAVTTSVAHAAPITVAEFRWDLLTEPGIECPVDDEACVPEDGFTQSVFSLTNLWDGANPDVTLFNNTLTLPGTTFSFLDLTPLFPFQFDQLAVIGAPAFASASVSFLFGTDVVTLEATLTAPDTFAVLQFDPAPVPEPGTFGLLACGLAMLAGRARRALAGRAQH